MNCRYGQGSTFTFHVRTLISDNSPTLYSLSEQATTIVRRELGQRQLEAIVSSPSLLITQSISQYLRLLKIEYTEIESEADLRSYISEFCTSKEDKVGFLFTTFDLVVSRSPLIAPSHCCPYASSFSFFAKTTFKFRPTFGLDLAAEKEKLEAYLPHLSHYLTLI